MQTFQRPIVEENFLGVNNRLPPQFLAPGEFVDLINVRISDGKIKKVIGTSAVANQVVSQPARGLAELENLTTNNKWIVSAFDGASNSAWYSWAGSGNFSLISGSNVMTNGLNFFFETALSTLYGFNGKDVGSWDGTTFTHNPGSIPKGYYPAWFHNYLFVARTDANPNRIYWSGLGDPTNFAGGISTVTVNAGGSGYAVGDILTVGPQANGSGQEGKLVVATLSGSAVATVSLLSAGSGYAVANGYATTDDNTTGTAVGTGCTINITAVDSTTLSNFVDVNPGDGDEIMGLGVLNDELFIFKKNTIWSLTGYSGASFTLTTKNTQNTNNRIYGYGCIAPGSIVSTGDDIYFLSFVGDVPHIRSLVKTQFATTIEGGTITENISGTMENINVAHASASVGIYDGRYIKWGIPTGSSTLPDFTIELDTYGIAKARGRTYYPFVFRVGIQPNFFVLSTISGKATVYFIDWLESGPYHQGYVYKFDDTIYTDLQVANQITVDVITRGYMPDGARKCKWKYLYLKYDTGQITTISVSSIIDKGNAINQATIDLNTAFGTGLDAFVLDTSTLAQSGQSASTRVNLAQMTGKIAQIQYSESSNSPITIYDWEVYYIPKGLRAN